MINYKLTSQDIERTIHEEILHLLEERAKVLPAISNAHELQADLGFASADLVQLLTALSTKLLADPFKHSLSLTEVRTVGVLCQAYQQFLAEPTVASADSDVLLATRRRAQARRDLRKG